MILLDYQDLSEHVGHELTVSVTIGGRNDEPTGLAIDCHTCGETVAVEDKP